MNENTSMSEEAIVGLTDEATDVSSRQKDRVKRRERLCKIWELDSDNSDVYSDSFDTDESSNSLRSMGILSMHIYSAALSFVQFVLAAQPL